jgi:beta-N-acetylhexosaminidase
MNTLSLSGLGQLFILQLTEAEWSPSLESLLGSCQPAGIILPARGLRHAETLRHLARRISGLLQVPPFLGVACDSFRGDPLRTLFPSILLPPSPRTAARKAPQERERLGKLRGAALRLLGCNVDFAFSLDLATAHAQTARASGTFGSDPQVVARCAAAYLRGLRSQKVLPCARHFPGLGSAELDPRTRTLLSAKPMVGLWREDLVPFRELLPQLPLLMISPAAYQAYDFDPPRPAMFSSNVVEGLLRTKLGYQAVAVASLPELARAGVTVGPHEAVVGALDAGCDLLVLKGNQKTLPEAIQAVRSSLESGRLPARCWEKSLARIATVKKSLATRQRAISESAAQRLAKQLKEWLKDSDD